MYEAFGNLILNCLGEIPNGVLVFVPSYKVLQEI